MPVTTGNEMNATAEAPPDSARIMSAIDATWPPAEMITKGAWVLRRGAGGGKRVSAASVAQPEGDPKDAAEAMRAWNQTPMFRLIPGEDALDTRLGEDGYAQVDPVALYAAPAAGLTGDGSRLAQSYTAAMTPARMAEIWEAGGIGPARQAIMERTTVPSARLMSRSEDRACGAAFVAVDGDVAMIHAIEVLVSFRRRGAAVLLMEAAARFATRHGARWLTLAVTEANAPARALYEKLGMTRVGRYHYRVAATP